MKYIVALCMSILSGVAFAEANANAENTYSITIENEFATVSPGGEVRFSVVGTPHPNHCCEQRVHFKLSDPSITDDKSIDVYWHVGEPLTERRYYKFRVNSVNSELNPRTIWLTAHENRSGELSRSLGQAALYVKNGTHGHPPVGKRGKYVTEIVASLGTQYLTNVWYEMFCISSTTGSCALNIKNGKYDNYHGTGQTYKARHKCSDSGFPMRTLNVRESLIFDSRKLVVKQTGDDPETEGETILDGAVCDIISDSPLMLRRVSPAHILPQL